MELTPLKGHSSQLSTLIIGQNGRRLKAPEKNDDQASGRNNASPPTVPLITKESEAYFIFG